jgi:hypothetical protein
METATTYTPSEPQATLRIGRQQAIERWTSFVSSAESLLKVKDMTLDKLLVALRKAIQFGSLEASLPDSLIEEELRKLVPFTLKDFHGMCLDDKNWTPGNGDGPSGLRAERLKKIAYANGKAYIDMYEAFCGHRVFGKPVPECPAE